jgi:nucleoid DNA-binding protein
MKRKELAKELGRTTHLTPAQASDRIDDLVTEILRRLRAREPIDLIELEKEARAGRLARPAGGK